jgi:hypothetical protein
MRYVFRFGFAFALSLALIAGCSDENGEGGSGGTAGTGGTGGSGGQGFPCTEQGIRDAIALGGGPHTFDCDGPRTVVTDAEIIINNDVILDGGKDLTVDGNDDHRVFFVDEGVTTELIGFTVVRGRTLALDANDARGFCGGGIRNQGTLTLIDSSVTECVALDGAVQGAGGGICAAGDTTVVNSDVSQNAARDGGGILCGTGYVIGCGRLTLIDSAVTGNTGGGVSGGEPLTLIGTTVSGNVGSGVGGFAAATITNSTVSTNTEVGISSDYPFGTGGAIALVNSTVTGNGDGALWLFGVWEPEPSFVGTILDGGCRRAWSSNGYNIESPGNTCGFDPDGTDLVNVSADDLQLGPLADNGGPTETHALGEGSVAIDQIPEVECVGADGEPLTTDQRGESRDSMCDIGAFELQP